MQQKVQFIGTLVHDPDLVILDEPFSGLDPINAQALKDAIVELKSRGQDGDLQHAPDGQRRSACATRCASSRVDRRCSTAAWPRCGGAHCGRMIALAVDGDGRRLVAPVLSDRG
jgi:ABC-2 type transport system ATP-binding protein